MGPTVQERNQQIVDGLHETIGSGSKRAQQLLQNAKNASPSEKVSAGRTLFYGVIQPHLLGGGDPVEPEIVAEATAWFEATFQEVEAANMATATSRSRSVS